MDLWVVAAAAGAGFLSKHWQNVIKERDGLSESFSGNVIGSATEDRQFDKRLERGRPKYRDRKALQNRLHRRRCSEEVSGNFDERLPIVSHLDAKRSTDTETLGIQSGCGDFLGDPSKEMASTSCVSETWLNSRKDETKKISRLVSLLYSRFCRKAINQEHGDNFEESVEFDDKLGPRLYPELSPRNFGLYYGFGRSRNTVNMKQSRVFSIKPMSSIESCLVAQIYREHVEMEEHTFRSLPSRSTPIVKPLVITDGKGIINTASTDPIIVQFDNREHKLNRDKVVGWKENEALIGIPPLPEIDLIEPKRKPKQQRGKLHRGRLSGSNMQTSEEHLCSQGLLGVLLFCFGIGVGVMSTILSNRQEVDRLSELVKETENLVQDLQEELEMKDSLTVKEFADDASQFQENNDSSFAINELDRLYHYDEEKPQIQQVEENSEPMSKIEAELEAELERLELSMNTSTLERRFFGLSEFDPDLIADVVHGELRINSGAEGPAELDPDASSTSSSTAEPHSSNYAVSPKELSLRLHQVLQSRLEERIEELETALHESQARLRSLEGLSSRKRYPNRNKEPPSMRDRPTRLGLQALSRHLSDEDEEDPLVHPLYLNMSGDSLDAYNHAYEEFIRMTETKELNSTSANDRSGQGLYPSMEMNEERCLVSEKAKIWERISSTGSNEVSESDNDEEEKLLIKHIVEKTRQGSPVVQNARRLLLLSMDE